LGIGRKIRYTANLKLGLRATIFGLANKIPGEIDGRRRKLEHHHEHADGRS
jgi:hypothetical protein